MTFDTETDSLSSANSGLVGVSLALTPGEACYIPLGHEAGEGLALEAAADLAQIPLAEAIARLKPMLEESAKKKDLHEVK